MVSDDIYTFIGATADGDAVFIDIAALTTHQAALRHGRDLLNDHARGACVEIWCGARLVAVVPRSTVLQAADA